MVAGRETEELLVGGYEAWLASLEGAAMVETDLSTAKAAEDEAYARWEDEGEPAEWGTDDVVLAPSPGPHGRLGAGA